MINPLILAHTARTSYTEGTPGTIDPNHVHLTIEQGQDRYIQITLSPITFDKDGHSEVLYEEGITVIPYIPFESFDSPHSLIARKGEQVVFDDAAAVLVACLQGFVELYFSEMEDLLAEGLEVSEVEAYGAVDDAEAVREAFFGRVRERFAAREYFFKTSE